MFPEPALKVLAKSNIQNLATKRCEHVAPSIFWNESLSVAAKTLTAIRLGL